MKFGENKVIDKHDREMQCFQRAVQIALKKRGETKRILKYLNGNDVVRKEEERPDIVKLCKNDSRGQCDTIVGIEHFRVDQLSIKKKDGRIASTGIVTEKNVWNMFIFQIEHQKCAIMIVYIWLIVIIANTVFDMHLKLFMV